MSHDSYIHHAKRGEPGAPILFVFHGTGGDENQFFDFGGCLLPNATVISPRGDISEHGAARFFRRKAEGVYDCEDLARATNRMSEFVTANREYYKAGPVLGLGFSNGANILASMLIHRPGLFEAAVLMHPLMPSEPKERTAKAGGRILITAGERDPIASVELTQSLADYFQRSGDEVDLEWHPGGHEIRSSEIEAAKRFLAPYRT
ncbi:esterase [Pseudorhizobium endolithicum]|uniref:Esterase n=1 Tax=Pseudorhizobium endolithicum TaxID=1191678 RepID=A0ABN7JTH0_9HYPH|nr:alpha/beta hydrolase [Pseudorhizobium endolithicum]CAD6409200.1 esterase [Rhizobium sp. Q54]CAD7041913.1 esterase [Pseudorhizobium endolithicum]